MGDVVKCGNVVTYGFPKEYRDMLGISSGQYLRKRSRNSSHLTGGRKVGHRGVK